MSGPVRDEDVERAAMMAIVGVLVATVRAGIEPRPPDPLQARPRLRVIDVFARESARRKSA